MTKILGSPFKTGSATIKLGDDNYEALVSTSELVPTATSSTFTAIDGTKYTSSGLASWVLNVTFAQDWTTAGSLSRFLYTNEGEKVTATLEPLDGGPGFTVDVTLVAPNIGGAADADAVSSVSFGCDGKPVLVPVAPITP